MRDPGSGMEGRVRRWSALVLLVPLLSLLPRVSHAQTVAEVLQQQRLDARLAEILAERGPRMEPRPTVELGEVDEWTARYLALKAAEQARIDSAFAAADARGDSIRAALRAEREAQPLQWRKVPAGGQGSFIEQYGETYWQASGTRGDLYVDSTSTRVLRGRLQAAFGNPTRNADAERRHGYGGSEYIQFEYWFVASDSIPALVTDIDGPFGTGLLVASDEGYAGLLDRVKRELSETLAATTRRDPWLDYYHSYERGQWFRVGYNGVEDFLVEVRPPRGRGQVDPDLWLIHR